MLQHDHTWSKFLQNSGVARKSAEAILELVEMDLSLSQSDSTGRDAFHTYEARHTGYDGGSCATVLKRKCIVMGIPVKVRNRITSNHLTLNSAAASRPMMCQQTPIVCLTL